MKRFFAGWIVALLLFVPSLGAACDLSCEFAQFASDCHLKRAATQESSPESGAMDGMAMADMTGRNAGNQPSISAASEVPGGHPSIGAIGPCERKSCEPDSTVVAKTARPFGQQFQTLPAVTKTFQQINTVQLAFHGPPHDLFPLGPDDRGLLITSLRI